MSKFNVIPHLEVNGCPYAEVSPGGSCIFVGIDSEETECFNAEEAIKLRDWLNEALGYRRIPETEVKS